MMMRVSTFLASASMPVSAWLARLRPSKVKGLVTTPTVSAPSSRAISAMTGAAPVPGAAALAGGDEHHVGALEDLADLVPALLGRRAPHLGIRARAQPRVILPPMWSFTSASHISSAWASVLTAMNSTPLSPASTMRLTALVPPPPTPTTLITAR